MKFDLIERKHILQATDELDRNAESDRSGYWIKIDEKQKEYPFKYLVRIALEKATGKKIHPDYFRSNPDNRDYFEDNFGYQILFYIPSSTTFFTVDQLEYFHLFGGEPYRKSIEKDIEAGEKIKATIYKKTNDWGKALNIKGFKVDLDSMWQISGYFKKYSWVTVYRREHNNPQIFFTVGISAESKSLVYKLDCQRKRKNALSKEQVRVFDLIVKTTEAGWSEIPFDELKHYNWDKLLDITRGFIEHYIPLYDEVYAAIFQPISISSSRTTKLQIRDVPKGNITLIPTQKVKPRDSNPDCDSENKRSKEIGDAGEQIVLEEERRFLRLNNREDLAEKVHKVYDWQGFDILSYDLDANERLIEVKTTTGSALRPFIFTQREKYIMQKNASNYYLYRLYYLDELDKSASCFILKGDFAEVVIEEPLKYNIYIKKL